MFPSQLAFHAVFQRHDLCGGYRDPFREIRDRDREIRGHRELCGHRELREIRGIRDRKIREYFRP